jgi:phosphate transport system protein
MRTDELLLKQITHMSELVREEVGQAKRAFAAHASRLAEEIVERDRDVNRLNREIFRRAVEIGGDPALRDWAMRMTLVARGLERIGDNAVDVGEQLAFVVTGSFREFSDASHVAPREATPAP